MNPAIWGPPFWFVLHTIAINYPLQPTFIERRSHYEFFRNLQSVIPCEECRKNYSAHFKQYPIDAFLDSKYALLQWTIIMHNLVNRLHGTPTMTTEEVVQLYHHVYDESATEGKKKAEAARIYADRYCANVPRNTDGSARCSCGSAARQASASEAPGTLKRGSIALGALAVFGVIAVVGYGVFRMRHKASSEGASAT